jgi:hypothetical protein
MWLDYCIQGKISDVEYVMRGCCQCDLFVCILSECPSLNGCGDDGMECDSGKSSSTSEIKVSYSPVGLRWGECNFIFPVVFGGE